MIFRTLSKEEYDRLTPDQKLDYLRRLMDDIGEKAMLVRQSIRDRKEQDEHPG